MLSTNISNTTKLLSGEQVLEVKSFFFGGGGSFKYRNLNGRFIKDLRSKNWSMSTWVFCSQWWWTVFDELILLTYSSHSANVLVTRRLDMTLRFLCQSCLSFMLGFAKYFWHLWIISLFYFVFFHMNKA